MPSELQVPLVGAGDEKVGFWRTVISHGVAALPPNRIDEDAQTLETTVRVDGRAPRTLLASAAGDGAASVEVRGRAPGAAERTALLERVAHLFRLDEDLADFYALAGGDAELSWAVEEGAGRLLRSETVFEEVVKTICTTNCAWSATERMVGALVAELGEPSAGGDGRAFPTPAAMAGAPESFYRDVARAGYRGAYLRSLAASVASGSLDLEALGRASADDLPDEELERALLALPGVGPYAAAHVMMLLGRYRPLILDSWSRPKFLRVSGMRRATDRTIRRRFARYGRYAGLAFWLYVTRDWA